MDQRAVAKDHLLESMRVAGSPFDSDGLRAVAPITAIYVYRIGLKTNTLRSLKYQAMKHRQRRPLF